MFSFFTKSESAPSIPDLVYGAVVAKARDPEFFTSAGVPDTVMGRFDMLALHVYLFSRRMKQLGDERALHLGQDVFDAFVADIERALRELGIGDTTVPKRKKRMVRSFYGQIEDFDALMDAKDADALTKAAGERYLNDGEALGAKMLSNYMLAADQLLSDTFFSELSNGRVNFPELGAAEAS